MKQTVSLAALGSKSGVDLVAVATSDFCNSLLRRRKQQSVDPIEWIQIRQSDRLTGGLDNSEAGRGVEDGDGSEAAGAALGQFGTATGGDEAQRWVSELTAPRLGIGHGRGLKQWKTAAG